jgi:hypothetical protein
MKAQACLLLFLSLTIPRALPSRSPHDVATRHHARKGGIWYFAQSGHAVYCFGPVMVMPQTDGGLQRVATFCQGEKPIVPLKD